VSEEIYLHDANVEALEIDVIGKVLRIRVSRHISPASRDRIPTTIEFRNVQSFSGILNFESLASNAWAGNISDWEPSSEFGVSYVYFVRGVASVHADQPIIS
jgi:hypothetical protein